MRLKDHRFEYNRERSERSRSWILTASLGAGCLFREFIRSRRSPCCWHALWLVSSLDGDKFYRELGFPWPRNVVQWTFACWMKAHTHTLWAIKCLITCADGFPVWQANLLHRIRRSSFFRRIGVTMIWLNLKPEGQYVRHSHFIGRTYSHFCGIHKSISF